MRLHIKATFAASALLLLAGCTDLDTDVKSKYTEYPSGIDAAFEAKLADAYYAFRGALGRNYSNYQTLSSDEASGISFDGDYYDNGGYMHPTLHDFSAEDDALNYWRRHPAEPVQPDKELRERAAARPRAVAAGAA